MNRDSLIIPPNLDTTIPERQEAYYGALPRAWMWMEWKGIPRLDKLGHYPRTRRGVKWGSAA